MKKSRILSIAIALSTLSGLSAMAIAPDSQNKNVQSAPVSQVRMVQPQYQPVNQTGDVQVVPYEIPLMQTVQLTESGTVRSEKEILSRQTNAFGNKYQTTSKKLAQEYGLSPIEEMFNGKSLEITGTTLKQVGYELFTGGSGSPGTAGKYDNSYKMSIGEKVNVYLQGDSVDVMAISGATLLNPVTKTEVDSKGNIFVQGLGTVLAEGRTIKEVENAFNKLAASKYKSLKVGLTISTGQEFSVFVFGQVNRPGKVLIGNNSTIFDALNAAGGVKKTGTLRNITYQSASKQKSVDLYKTIFAGQDDGVILKPNDKIFVNKIGNVVAIKNGVIEPGIYETKDGENIQKLVSYAGGLSATTQVHEVTLIGFNKELKQKTATNIAWDKAQKTVLNNGDSIEFRELYNEVENIVTIQGNIKHPATYAYTTGMRLSDILSGEDELLEESFINQAVIRRVSGKDNSVTTIPIFLKDFFSGVSNPVLQPRDVITIYRNTNSEFVDVYGCVNMPKRLTYVEGLTLSDLMSDIQFIETDIVEQEQPIDVKVSNKKNKKNQESTEDSTVTLSGGTTNDNKLIPADKVAVEITNQEGDTTLYYLYDIMINSDNIKSIKIEPNDKIFFRPLRGNETVKKVKISGFVRVPGVYTSIENKRLSDMIEMAGGLSGEAELRGIVFKRANLQGKQIQIARKNIDRDIKLIEGRIATAYKASESDQKSKMDMLDMLRDEENELSKRYTGQISLNIKNNDLNKISKSDNIEIQDGDDIYIPRVMKQVSVMGEVYNEQSFAYRPGMKPKYYIKKVGGYTPNSNRFRLYKVGVNGRAQKIRTFTTVEAGDVIVVPRKIAGNDYITPICDTLKGLSSIFLMAFAMKRW